MTTNIVALKNTVYLIVSISVSQSSWALCSGSYQVEVKVLVRAMVSAGTQGPQFP